MAHVSDLIATDIEQYLKSHETKSLLRFITCGSVDDGKSTLIGRLLYESKMLFEDQLAALEADSKKVGTREGEIDYALLLDGLAAEREQGITIDVAYRFFSTDRRKFIVADTPGHEQYTRNMITGASTADLAIILIDSRKGVLVQTRRHSYLVSLIGIRHIILAINKMDLVHYSKETYDKIEAEYRDFAKQIGITDIHVIPISGVKGDNIVEKSANTPWYNGPTLMHLLETVQIDEEYLQKQTFRLPVQWVNRPNLDFRGFTGTIASGVIHPGDRIRVIPSGRESTITRIVMAENDLDVAVANQSITLTLADEVDISRGDVICTTKAPAQVADLFEATLVWMTDQPLFPGRSYLLKIGPKTVNAKVLSLSYKINVNTLEQTPTDKLDLNEICVCKLELDRPVAFDPYIENRETGGFILIDRLTNNTVGAGMVRSGSRRVMTADWQSVEVNRQSRARLKGQRPCVVAITGGATGAAEEIATFVERKLHAEGRHTILLEQQRSLPIQHIVNVLLDTGLIVLVNEGDLLTLSALLKKGEYVAVEVNPSEPPREAAERIVSDLHQQGYLDSESEEYAI